MVTLCAPLLTNGAPLAIDPADPAHRVVSPRTLKPVRVAALGGHDGSMGPGLEITPELARQRVKALQPYAWSSYVLLAGIKPTPEWLRTEEILELPGSGSRGKRQSAFRKQLEGAAALGRRETGWKSQIKYTVFLVQSSS